MNFCTTKNGYLLLIINVENKSLQFFIIKIPYDTIQNCKDSVEYQRIYSRIIEMCIPVMVIGGDFRKIIQGDKLNRD